MNKDDEGPNWKSKASDIIGAKPTLRAGNHRRESLAMGI